MSTTSRIVKRLTLATAGVGLAVTLVAGPAGADVGAPEPEVTMARILLSNAVNTGVVETTAKVDPVFARPTVDQATATAQVVVTYTGLEATATSGGSTTWRGSINLGSDPIV